VSLGEGLLYSMVAGVFIGLCYLEFWTGTSPFRSTFNAPFPQTAVLFGVCAWAILVRQLALYVWRWRCDGPQPVVAPDVPPAHP
jgi:hypothetical protein